MKQQGSKKHDMFEGGVTEARYRKKSVTRERKKQGASYNLCVYGVIEYQYLKTS
jgi:hypothetical protein